MRKFNNTLEGTDCGDAGLPSHHGIAKAKTGLRIVAKTPDIGSTAVQFPERRDRQGARASHPMRRHPIVAAILAALLAAGPASAQGKLNAIASFSILGD